MKKIVASSQPKNTFSRGCRQLSGQFSIPTAAASDRVALAVPERGGRGKNTVVVVNLHPQG